MKPIIFCDFDGVLNSAKFFNKGYSSILYTGLDELDRMDPAAVQLLNTLIDQTQAHVVISSTWRLFHSLDKINEILKLHGATFSAFDTTEDLAHLGKQRGHEIQAYLDAMPIKPTSFVIFDDNSDMAHLKETNHFIQTDFYFGLEQKHIDLALKVLL